jgi:hypothetical protein
MNPYGHIFQQLNTAGIEYIVVGGVAMNLHGLPRFTGDIDILLALDSSNIEKMSILMKEMGYEKRLPVTLEELGDEKHAVQLIKEKNLIAFTFNNPEQPQASIDIVVGESLRFENYKKHCVFVDTWGLQIPVVSIDDLIDMKRATHRQKDIEDVAFLLELKGL